MTKLEDIKSAVSGLSDKDRISLLNWLAELDWQAWDKQIESDGAAGKLDAIEARVVANHKAGKTREL